MSSPHFQRFDAENAGSSSYSASFAAMVGEVESVFVVTFKGDKGFLQSRYD